MPTRIYISLPVKDLSRSMRFFTTLGYSFEQALGSDNAGCMVVSDHIYVMLLSEPLFEGFSNKEVCDTSRSAESILCLSAPSRMYVDEITDRALKAGAVTKSAAQENGPVYSRGFSDLDGHQWELMYLETET